MTFGQRFRGRDPDPVFSTIFLIATALNYLPVALADPELIVASLLHPAPGCPCWHRAPARRASALAGFGAVHRNQERLIPSACQRTASARTSGLRPRSAVRSVADPTLRVHHSTQTRNLNAIHTPIVEFFSVLDDYARTRGEVAEHRHWGDQYDESRSPPRVHDSRLRVCDRSLPRNRVAS